MLALLKRWLPVVLGFLLIAVFIWFAGPYFAFAEFRPLQSAFARIVAITVVVLSWVASQLLKRMRARAASRKLSAAVVKQSEGDAGVPQDVVKLREGFEH